MKTIAVSIALLCLHLIGSAAAAAALLEPDVKRIAGVLPEEACKELIQLGEAEGFTVDVESIDEDEQDYHVPSQSIEIFERYDGITSPAIWKALEPWIPKLTDLVRQSIDRNTDSLYFPDQPDRVPKLGWVFFRKYSPTSERKSLKLHVDSNMHTVNIALNDDYEGGGLFYVRPPEEQDESLDDRPEIPARYLSYGWVDSLERRNTSDVVFPTLETGDVLIYNFTLWHAVAPVAKGTRYSFVLFYDMDNPAIQEDFDPQNGGEEDDSFPVSFYHEMEDEEIDLAFVEYNDDGEEVYEIMKKNMPPHREVHLDTYEGHEFVALISGTKTIVAKFVIREVGADIPLS